MNIWLRKKSEKKLIWKDYEKTLISIGGKLNQTREEIKQEFKLLIKDRKIRELNNIIEANSEDKNGRNLIYQCYSLM